MEIVIFKFNVTCITLFMYCTLIDFLEYLCLLPVKVPVGLVPSMITIRQPAKNCVLEHCCSYPTSPITSKTEIFLDKAPTALGCRTSLQICVWNCHF